MIRRDTWIVLFILAILVAFAVILNRRQSSLEAEPTPTGGLTYLFTSEDGNAISIEIAPAEGNPVRIARNSEDTWVIEMPFAASADQGLAEAAATQVGSLRVLDDIQGNPEIFGLDDPGYIITIRFSTGKEHILEVGSKTPTNSGYYVRLDDGKMTIVALSGIEALLKLITSPPYLETPTPSALPPSATPLSGSTDNTTPTP